jgi:hypothetical protein
VKRTKQKNWGGCETNGWATANQVWKCLFYIILVGPPTCCWNEMHIFPALSAFLVTS